MTDPFDEETNLRTILETLDAAYRDTLRRVLIHDQADRDAVSSRLLRYRERPRRRLGRHHRHADDAFGRPCGDG
jgi:hypothetical protein